VTAGALPTVRLLIGGEWINGQGPEFELLDKYSLKPIGEIASASDAQIVAAVRAANAAYRRGAPDPARRGAILDRAAELLKVAGDEIVRLIQIDTGFTLADGRGELQRGVETLLLAAHEARTLAGDIVPLAGAPGQVGRFGYTLRVPIGVVAAITPFNSPLNTLLHKVAPAFAAGNAVIAKPSSHTPLTAFRLAQILHEAGVPPGFVSLLYGGSNAVKTMLDQPEVRYIAFTGSTEVGRILQTQAGLRRTQMELGSIAFTILNDDADLERALPRVVAAAYRKAGQVCTSIQNLLVHESILDTVTGRLTELVRRLAYGDPSNPVTVCGPTISADAAVRVEKWIGEAIDGGATLLAGGSRQGAVIPPTLLSGVGKQVRLGCEEVFGPVMCVMPFATLGEAIDMVNDTPYGLASGIFTNRLDDAFAATRRLEVGTVHINETSSARVDMMPYGGSKDSGFGREGPHYAIREMTEERMVTFAGLE
jgi:succinate-semialdehyde dehydrogenase/glutarate-semialdehyde dehydrogenase